MANVRNISTVEEFEQHAVNIPPGNVSFRLRPTSSLRACAKLKLQVQGGNSAYRLHNPEMLDCKVRAHRSVEDGMDQLILGCTHDMELQIDDANACITRLKGLLRTPDADMPVVETDLANRGTGLHQYIFRMPPQPNPFWDYDVQQQGAVNAHATEAVQHRRRAQDLASHRRAQDLASQRAIWRMNLEAQKKRKELLTEYTYAVGRAFRELKTKFLEEETEAGSGYADFRLLCWSDQQDYAPN